MGISTHLENCAQAYLAQSIIMHSLRSFRVKLPEGNRKIRIISRAICEQRKLADAEMSFLGRHFWGDWGRGAVSISRSQHHEYFFNVFYDSRSKQIVILHTRLLYIHFTSDSNRNDSS